MRADTPALTVRHIFPQRAASYMSTNPREILVRRSVSPLILLALVGVVILAGCSDDDCELNPDDPTQYVVVGFWSSADCSGDPVATNAFPVESTAPCYCWPGHSGENSADTFMCDPANRTFTYTQYGSLTCGEDDDTPTVKTVYSDQCKQDIPPTLYAKILDYGACEP